MDFKLSEEQEVLQKMVRDFAEKEVKPRAAEVDRTHAFPHDTVAKAAELGLMGVAVPDQWGGAGMDYISYAIAIEEVSRACATTGVVLSVNNSLVCDPLKRFGTDAQRERFLTPLASGEKIGCFGLTEPNAGTDAANVATKAVKEGDTYVLNGTKNFISNGSVADTALVFASLDRSQGHKGMACFIVEKGTEGYAAGKEEDKMGICGSACSELVLENVRVPADQRLGGEGEGFKVAMYTLDGGRIGIAAQAVGIARAAMEDAAEYAKQRVQFGKPIAAFQGIQWLLADMRTKVEAARLLTLSAAWAREHRKRSSVESAMAKLFAAEAATSVTHAAIQVHGGYGYIKEYAVERYYRDARVTEIYEGTNEVQKMVIAASMTR
jgi:butyryl-CoA dehydrogenase